MILDKRCPMCGGVHFMEVDEEKLYEYEFTRALIQEVFPDLNPHEREFIKTGYCPECQELLFGTTYEGNKIKNMHIFIAKEKNYEERG